jgi:hypothetical protein
MRGKRTREEEGYDKRLCCNEMWTDGGAAGREATEDMRQHDNEHPDVGNSNARELLDALQAKIALGLLTARVKRGTKGA